MTRAGELWNAVGALVWGGVHLQHPLPPKAPVHFIFYLLQTSLFAVTTNPLAPV